MIFTALISSCEVSKFHAAMRQAYAVQFISVAIPIRGAQTKVRTNLNEMKFKKTQGRLRLGLRR